MLNHISNRTQMNQVLQQRKVRLLYAPPSLIESLVDVPGGMDTIKQIDVIIYAGEPLAKHVGDELVKHTRVSTICKRYFETIISGICLTVILQTVLRKRAVLHVSCHHQICGSI